MRFFASIIVILFPPAISCVFFGRIRRTLLSKTTICLNIQIIIFGNLYFRLIIFVVVVVIVLSKNIQGTINKLKCRALCFCSPCKICWFKCVVAVAYVYDASFKHLCTFVCFYLFYSWNYNRLFKKHGIFS